MKVLKSRIFAFILGGIIFSAIGVFAYAYNAGQITYTPKDSNWKVNNVKSAIDDLNGKVMREITLQGSVNVYTSGGGNGQIKIDNFKQYFKYFTVTNNTCSTIASWSIVRNKGESLTVGEKYLIDDDINGYISVYGENTSGMCSYIIKLTNSEE